ncbi:PQQ-binding-like beta-propeller repeat protein [Methanoculleus chikugoensis]|uniref:WD40 repeat domain-containing protein n=1 Tax=Methanoculleus chikugoensis TaxID=118126 RepID=UPI0006D27A99|nr:PQQ-binding-like beta-propeller repeat protein [Methanoculleus chikugoensis]
MAVTHDGSTIVASAGSMVYLLDRQGNVLWQNSAGARVNGVGISPEGSWIGVAADKLYLYNRDGDLLWTVKTSFIYRSVDLSSNGMYVAAGCDNGAVYIFDRNKKQLWDYDMGTDSYGLAISENGRRIAIGCDNQGGVYLLNSREGESWSYGTGRLVRGGLPSPPTGGSWRPGRSTGASTSPRGGGRTPLEIPRGRCRRLDGPDERG